MRPERLTIFRGEQMSYGADFANADPANAPLNGPLFIGADPFVWAAILLALAAALLLGWYLGARSSSHRADAAHAIWEAIHDAARSAMGADDNALKGRAEHLLKIVDNRLGKTLGLAKGLSGRISKLKDAVDGKGPADAHGHGHGHGGGHGAGHGGHGAQAPAHDAHAAHDVHATPAVTIVNVNAGATSHAPAENHAPAHDARTEKRDLTQREQTDALRLAVAAFNQHWRDESARVRELRDAYAELCNPGPPRAARPPAGRISGTRAKH
ncbi:hypothetical protein GCM10007859_05250 [Brevundimonas denitrificans]|uniref:DUF4381 domain-containing protein n=2 Tax=Brevundimonas denitrificans TaxID=1443434 RepID=A0ABQ6BLA0_9CAUL|nr:hypothetical protein GCM10007859_05250 [Brevundimonas denitrificans]